MKAVPFGFRLGRQRLRNFFVYWRSYCRVDTRIKLLAMSVIDDQFSKWIVCGQQLQKFG